MSPCGAGQVPILTRTGSGPGERTAQHRRITRRTCPAAAARPAGIATGPERPDDLVGDLAGALHHVGVAVAQRDQAVRGAPVVATDVAPALALRMRREAVQFDDHPVLLVTNVFVLRRTPHAGAALTTRP